MPVYFVLTKKNLSKDKKDDITQSLTDAHCQTTGAPSNFVTIIFLAGYRLKDRKKALLLGNIRTGGNRTQEVVDRLKHALLMALTNNLGLSVNDVGLKFLGVNSDWVWEGGEVLPAPGEEKATHH